MKKIFTLLFLSLLCAVVISCQTGKNKKQPGDVVRTADTTGRLLIKYAQGFRVEYYPGYILLGIKDPQNESTLEYQFALKERESKVPTPPDIPVIEIPVKSLICMTSLQLSNLIKLDATDRVVGISSGRFLDNPKMQQQVAEGKTRKIGIEGNFDSEIIISLAPDLIFISPFKQGGYDAMKEVDIPLVPHLGYKEMTPLGQAEWIKFAALFLGMEEQANRKFEQIENDYNRMKALAANVSRRPVVFSGELRGGVWYAVGGKSYLAQLFKDAGADYFLKDDPRSGGVNLDFETVYNQAESAEFWRILNSYPGKYSYDALKAQDSRYTDFKAFREKGIIYCNMREKAFYENTPVEPETVLADLIKAFHPELLPDYHPVYYELLKK